MSETLGPYELVRLLGRGGMGEVHLAHDARLGRNVALKLLPINLADDPERRARFLREARAAASLSHPNITTTLDVGEEDGRDYIAQELVEGTSLSELIGARSMPLDELADLSVPLADALAYAHEHGVIHRDLKAANVIVTDRGNPKLLDFGLAKMLNETAGPTLDQQSTTLTISGAIFGTPGAMSPEQALGKTVDARSDVFSFGSLLYEMASGKPAFLGTTVQETLDKVLHAEAEPLERLRRDLPSDFIAIVNKALRKEPTERYQSMADLGADLRHFRRHTDSGLLPPAKQRAARGRGRALVLAALVMLLAAAAWYVLSLGDATAPDGGGARLIAVMFFENLADPEDSAHQGTMLTRLLDNELAAVADLDLLSQQRLFDTAKAVGGGDGLIDRSTATEVARRAGVTTMIVGELSRIGSRLVARASIIDVESGRTLASHQVESGSEDEIFSMARALGEQARGSLLAGGGVGVAAPMTDSVDALRAYVRGEEFLNNADYSNATAAFTEAATLDQDFAMAHYRRAMAGIWRSEPEENLRAIDRAFELADKLPAETRQVLDASRLFVLGDYGRALPLLESLLLQDADNKDLLYMLGEVRTHSPMVNDSVAAIEAFERLLELDPHFGMVYQHLLHAYARLGRWDEVQYRLDAWQVLAPERVEELRQGLMSLGPPRGWGAPEPYARPSYSDLSQFVSNPYGYEILAEDWVALDDVLNAPVEAWLKRMREGLEAQTAEARVPWFVHAAMVNAYRGRFERGRRIAGAALELPVSREGDGMAAAELSTARALIAELALLAGDHESARAASEANLAALPNAARPLYAEVRLSLRLGDEARAKRALDDLDRLEGRRLSSMVPLYRDAARAEWDLHHGEASAARHSLERIVVEVSPWGEQFVYQDSSALPLFQDALARARAADGDRDGAAAMYGELLDGGLLRQGQPLLWVSALFTLGEMEWDAGNEESGRALLERFLEYWGDADTDLPMVSEARGILGR